MILVLIRMRNIHVDSDDGNNAQYYIGDDVQNAQYDTCGSNNTRHTTIDHVILMMMMMTMPDTTLLILIMRSAIA